MEMTINQALQKAINAHKDGNFIEADRFYTAILKDQPEHPDANHNLGILCVNLGQNSKAIPFFKTAIKTSPTNHQFWLSYINILINSENLNEAKNAFIKAKKNGVESNVLKKLEKKLNSLEGVNGLTSKLQDPSQDQFQSIIDLYKQRKFQLVIEQSEILLKKFPSSSIIHNIMGASFANLDKLDKALKSYNDAISANPEYIEAINNIGILLKRQGNKEKAIETFKKALSIKPDYAEPYYNIANILNGQGKYHQAIDNYKKVISLSPNHVDAYNNMGITFRNQGNLLESIESFNKGLQIKPDYIEILSNLGISLLDLGRLEEAQKAFKKVILIKPNYTDGYNNLGATFKEQGKIKDAVEAYKKSLELNPNYPGTLYNLGFILFEKGDWNESLKYFQSSIKFSKDDTISLEKSRNMILKVLYLLGKKDIFLNHLHDLKALGKTNAVIGSFTTQANKKFGIKVENSFCNNPMELIVEKSLLKECNFQDLFIKKTKKILDSSTLSEKQQLLLLNGTQTAGNILSDYKYFDKEVMYIIKKEIENYRHKFKNSLEGLIKEWPENFEIRGWLINMKSGGFLKSHFHENGWLSGSIYINVPEIKKNNSGNLVLSLYDEENQNKNIKDSKKILNVKTGDLCLFPSSLNHYTIPFEANEKRIVLAFDIEARA